MATTVKLKQSAVAGKVPTTSQLQLGELAVNTTDGKLFLKKNVSGTESIVDVTAGGMAPATASALGGVKGFTNLTIDSEGALSLLAANIAAALGYTPQPTGIMQPFAGSAAPDGWLLCDGSAVSRTTYAALFAVIGTTYGAGNGSSTFNLPDMRDRVPVGASTTRTLGSKAGAATQTPAGSVTVNGHTLTIEQVPAHSHGVSDPGHAHGVYDAGHRHSLENVMGTSGGQFGIVDSLNTGSTGRPRTLASGTGIGIYGAGTGISINNNGGGQAHSHGASFAGTAMSVEQPYTAVNFIIKT